ncbi:MULTISPECIES: hypothetical protein [unclassified Pandoraea]|uniref:hypothetical protein n=1 Tax=unclassified Pandoraea TaxID=2624094 RepID=UPI000B3FA351|nr:MULTISPECIES: hypothetical protein [unclassified Pandoraea]
MKRTILESMDKGIWYAYETLAGMSGFSRWAVAKACRELVADGVLECDFHNHKKRVRLAMRRMVAKAPTYECTPTVAGPRYAPKWTPLKSYAAYFDSHKALCEVAR